METRRALLVDAFADEPMAGNPAGVVPDADGLTDRQMQAVAGELGASETAFVRESDAADLRLRYFTPETEVDLCGHATVAALLHLRERGRIADGERTVETNQRRLDVSVDEETAWLTTGEPDLREVDLDRGTVADALGIDVAALEDVGADLPLVRGSVGVGFLLVPVNYFEHLRDADPDQRAVEALADDVDATGVYPFTFDTLAPDATLHGRAFAPGAGIPEDPVTGTASAVVAGYLRRYGALDADVAEVVCEQGHFLDRPGRVRVDVREAAVRVGGRAVTALDGDLAVPSDDGDDIIEA
ncbi:MAG: PhzF family phenazine biosynthesis protein [Haloarculaceae archaeon]